MTKIVLDAEAFKALASDTRLQILKALDARPLTVSELSRLLNLNKATVFEHLKQLMAADLAKREDDPARKWVYYRLTWKGKNVLHPENAQIFLMLGMAALGLGGALLQTAYLAQLWLQTQGTSAFSSSPSADLLDGEDSNRTVADQQDAPADAPQSNASSAAGSSEPQPAAAGASSPTGSGAQATMEKSGAGEGVADTGVTGVVVRDDSLSASAGDNAWWEPLTSNYFLTLLGILVFLGLLSLIVWTLYGGQRRERLEYRRRIVALPADVNAQEPQAGKAA